MFIPPIGSQKQQLSESGDPLLHVTRWHLLPLSLLVPFPVALKWFCSCAYSVPKLPQGQMCLYSCPCPGSQGHSAYPTYTGHCAKALHICSHFSISYFSIRWQGFPSLEALQRQSYTPLSRGGRRQPTEAIFVPSKCVAFVMFKVQTCRVMTAVPRRKGQWCGPHERRPSSGLSK